MMGKPVIRGTRITLELISRKLSEGAKESERLEAHPKLKPGEPTSRDCSLLLISPDTRIDEKVEVFEEREFKTISEAARILLDWWPRYRPECYYAVIGDCTFVSDLEDLLKKEKADNIQTTIFEKNIDYGNQVINEYLNNDRLSVPRNGVLHHQFETNWEDLGQSKQLLHGIEALRYLMVSIKSYRWKPLKKEQLRRGPLTLSDIAAFDIRRAWREAGGEWDYDYMGFIE